MGIPSMLIFTRGFFLQVSSAFALVSPFCGPGGCLDELLLARFLLKDRIGGQPTTGAGAPLPWTCGLLPLLRTDAAAGAFCGGGGQHPFFLSLAAAIFFSSASSFPHPALVCCFCLLQPSVLASTVSKNPLFVPVVVVLIVDFEGLGK
uniref:Secreted protein n=1 Tax=Arundo donax TaxID=35708 RepID=A0A0A9EZU7_ARUDO